MMTGTTGIALATHSRSLRVLTMAGVLLSGACSGIDRAAEGADDAGTAAQPPVVAPPPHPRPELARTEPNAGATPTPQTRYHPRRLIGLDRSQLREALGLPDAVRDEASSLIWSFHGRDCVLDVVLYASVDGKELRVLQYNVDSRSPDGDPDGDLCVGEMTANARERHR